MAGVGRDANPPRPTLRLYTYASHAALVGRYQTLAAEVDVDACAATGTGVSRRPTGGGAIVMGRDQLGVALVLPAPATAAPPRTLIPELGQGVIEGLRRIGVRAEFGGKNDLLAGGRKIAGLGMYTDGKRRSALPYQPARRPGRRFHAEGPADPGCQARRQGCGRRRGAGHDGPSRARPPGRCGHAARRGRRGLRRPLRGEAGRRRTRRGGAGGRGRAGREQVRKPEVARRAGRAAGRHRQRRVPLPGWVGAGFRCGARLPGQEPAIHR